MYQEESKKYVKNSRNRYLRMSFVSFYKDYYSKTVENPLERKLAKEAFKIFFKNLYQKIIIDKYIFKMPILGDRFYVAESSKPSGATFINWKKTKEGDGTIIREINIGLNGRKPYYRHDRAKRVEHGSLYQLTPIEGKPKDFYQGKKGLWRYINTCLQNPLLAPYRANL